MEQRIRRPWAEPKEASLRAVYWAEDWLIHLGVALSTVETAEDRSALLEVVGVAVADLQDARARAGWPEGLYELKTA